MAEREPALRTRASMRPTLTSKVQRKGHPEGEVHAVKKKKSPSKNLAVCKKLKTTI